MLVFWRGTRDGWKRHVGFYAGEDASAYHVLGGNQNDSVSLARIGKERLLDIRWPATVPLSAGGPVVKEARASLSTDES